MTKGALISIEPKEDEFVSQPESRLAEIEERTRSALAGVEKVEIVDMMVHTPANIDPAAIQELVTSIRSITEVAGVVAISVGAADSVIKALRKLAEDGSALIRSVKIQIGGERRPLETVTPKELADEMNRPAVD